MDIKSKLQEAEIIIKEFQKMRNMQREYFRYRDYDQFKKCKLQEKKVDGMAEAYWKANQGKLF